VRRSGGGGRPSRRSLPLRVAAVAGGVVCLLGTASPASAHPVLTGADPAPGSIQQRPPSSLTLRFAGLIEPGRSSVTLAAADTGRPARLEVATSTGHLLQARLPRLAVGTYGVAYSVTGFDGHVVTSRFYFAYWPSGAPAPAGLGDLGRRSTRFSAASSLPRAVAMTASLPLSGLMLMAAVFLGRGRRKPRGLTATLAGLSLLVAVSDLAALALTGGPGQIARSRYGLLIGLHAAIALWLLFLARFTERSRSGAVAGAGLLVPLALTSHEFALSTHPLLSAAVDFAHLVSAAVWVGGLCWLLLRLVDRDGASLLGEARRFSTLAGVAALVVVASGTSNAWSRIPSWVLLFGSGYGRVLLVKILLVAGVLGIALANRRLARQRSMRPGSGRTLVGEGLTMAAVLAMAAVLVSMTPPPRIVPAPAAPLLQSVVLGDRAYSVLMFPALPGQNTVTIRPLDAGTATGAPAEAPQTQLVSAGRGPRPVALQQTASGWTGSLELPRTAAALRLFAGGTLQELSVTPSSGGAPLELRATATVAGPDGDECRSGVVGEMAAVADYNQESYGRPKGRTASLLVTAGGATTAGLACNGPRTGQPDPRAAGRLFSRFLVPYQVRKVALVTDGGDRAAAFAAGLSEAGGIPATAFSADRLADARAWAPDAIVVAGGPAAAAAVGKATADGTWLPSRGVFLAPWLLDSGLLETAIANHGPQFTIGLTFDPFGQEARRYLSALARFAPFESPSAAGFAGYVHAVQALSALTRRPATPDDRPLSAQFFAAVQVSFLPAQFDHGETHLWLGTGGLALVSGVVRDPGPPRR
jgi:copper transport protein